MLSAMMAWILHDSYPRVFPTGPGILGVMWISIHSTTLQDFMARKGSPISDQLRIQGRDIEVSLLNLNTGSFKPNGDENSNIKLSSTVYYSNWQQFVAKGKFFFLFFLVSIR